MQSFEMHLNGRQPTPEFEQLQQEVAQVSERTSSGESSIEHRRSPNDLQINRIAVNPIVAISAAPWTSITNDDDLVSNLISLWLTWDHIWYCWVDSDMLIPALQSGDRQSTVCSPFLVNCILAWACPYSDYQEARTEHGKVSSFKVAEYHPRHVSYALSYLTDQIADTVLMRIFRRLL